MSISRWVSLLIVVAYVASLVFSPGRAGTDEQTETELWWAITLGGMPLLLGFLCIWCSESLGNALWVGRGAWNPKPSTEGAVILLGWVFLLSAVAIRIVALWRRG